MSRILGRFEYPLVVDAYRGPASVLTQRPEHLGAVHVDVAWQDGSWWGVMTAEPNAVEWVGRPLVLKIEDHPEATFTLETTGTQSEAGRWTIRFQGSGPPPFWCARPSTEIIAELRKRRPAAASLHPGIEPPSYAVPDRVSEKLREILVERDGLNDEEIDRALWS